VSKDLSKALDSHRDWDRILERFFSDSENFRSFQVKFNGIVIGNTVLGYFARTNHCIQGDTTLILLLEDNFGAAGTTFLEGEGYVSVIANVKSIVKYYQRSGISTQIAL
jgi:hypothetical protein